MSDIKISFHADDLGMSKGFNSAIKKAHLEGVLDSASIIVNGLSFNDAVKNVVKNCPNLKIGLHLNISENPKNSQYLLGEIIQKTKFYFLIKFFYHIIKSFDKKHLKIIEIELRKQFEIAKLNKIKIDHVNSHEHFCTIPKIFEIVCNLCNRFNVKKIKLSK